MVARFDPYKDHANLIQALARLHARGLEFCGVFIGTGVDLANKTLMNQIALSGLTEKVRLLGPLDDIPAVMNGLDLHVLSSSAEAFPNVLAEAMACGTPCVATDVGDAAAILGDTGWVAPPGNPTVLADAIETALRAWAHQELWLERQQRCRQRVCDKYALEKMVESYRDIWTEVGASRAS
jgi:glycosyltransferase involved in cell wall biosynthesis